VEEFQFVKSVNYMFESTMKGAVRRNIIRKRQLSSANNVTIEDFVRYPLLIKYSVDIPYNTSVRVIKRISFSNPFLNT
jgi:hypothetical protein